MIISHQKAAPGPIPISIGLNNHNPMIFSGPDLFIMLLTGKRRMTGIFWHENSRVFIFCLFKKDSFYLFFDESWRNFTYFMFCRNLEIMRFRAQYKLFISSKKVWFLTFATLIFLNGISCPSSAFEFDIYGENTRVYSLRNLPVNVGLVVIVFIRISSKVRFSIYKNI